MALLGTGLGSSGVYLVVVCAVSRERYGGSLGRETNGASGETNGGSLRYKWW